MCTLAGESEAAQATTSRVELELEGLCVQADSFATDSPRARRLAISVRRIDFKDCALKVDAAPAWQKIFTQYLGVQSERGPASCLLTVRRTCSELPHACGEAQTSGHEMSLLVHSVFSSKKIPRT